MVVIKAQATRSQEQNKAEALERLQEMVDQAAFVPRIRRATKPTRGSQLRRLESKMTRGRIKSLRGKVSE